MRPRLTEEQQELVRRALAELGEDFDESGHVPAWTCRHIECLTDGEVTRYQLRPDLFPTHESAEDS